MTTANGAARDSGTKRHEPDADGAALWRLFVAIDVPGEVRHALQHITDDLKRARAHVSWVPSRNLHLTLRFLGDVPRLQVPEVANALGGVAAVSLPFPLRVSELGTFGSCRSPRVVWVGCEPCPTLDALYAAISEEFEPLGFEPEQRPFRPHITLGRVRSSRGRRDLVEALRDASMPVTAAFDVTSVVLYRSRLAPGGAVHQAVHEVLFAPSSR